MAMTRLLEEVESTPEELEVQPQEVTLESDDHLERKAMRRSSSLPSIVDRVFADDTNHDAPKLLRGWKNDSDSNQSNNEDSFGASVRKGDAHSEGILASIGTSIGNIIDNSMSWTEQQQEKDGVITHMGKRYNARDMLQRSLSRGNSIRSLSSHTPNDRSLGSIHEEKFNGSNKNDDLTANSTHSLQARLTRGLSKIPLGDNHNRPTVYRSQSCRHFLGTNYKQDDNLDSLMVQLNDVTSIANDPKGFAALKAALKENGAITNNLLQQGLPGFVYQHKKQKARQEKKERKRQQSLLLYQQQQEQSSVGAVSA